MDDVRPTALEKYQPHWLWFLLAVVVPLALMALTVFGVDVGAPVSARFAARFPFIAVLLSAGVTAAAVINRRAIPIRISVAGLCVSILLLLWLRLIAGDQP